MDTIRSYIHPAKPDINHPSLFKEGTRMVVTIPPLLGKEGTGEVTTRHGNNHTTPPNTHPGEKWESDKKRNNTQQTSHTRTDTLYLG
jgi:hypothetical protein